MKGRPLPWAGLAAALALGAAAYALWPLFGLDAPWPSLVRDHLEERGLEESGARNLVSAIYLGYRAYDTLGETLVLLVAVTGTLGMIGGAKAGGAKAGGAKAGGAMRGGAENGGPGEGPARAGGRAALPRARTELMSVIAGKLGPVVLVFGLYVMLYGHISPGGGFQGGVVVASGVVFLALGSRGAPSPLVGPRNLARIEAAAFFFLMIASGLGLLSGRGFLAPPLAGHSPVGYIVALNALIGVKAGAGIGLLCVAMLGEGLP